MNFGITKSVFYALTPLLILLFCITLSSILSYLLLFIAGDIISMQKIISKATQIFLILSIFPLKHILNLTWSDIGFSSKQIFLKQLALGLLLGLATLAPVLLVLHGLDVSVIDQSKDLIPAKIISNIAIALLLASLIALGEESLFNGILLAGLRKKFTLSLAILISSSYYSALHFVKTKTHIPYKDLNIYSGFRLVEEAFMNLLNPEIILAFIGLLAVGIFLAVIRSQFNNSIGICIGCHLAWVWQIKINKDFFDTNVDAEYYFLVSDYYDGIVGPLVTIWLLFVLMAYFIVKNITWRRF